MIIEDKYPLATLESQEKLAIGPGGEVSGLADGCFMTPSAERF